MEFMNDFDFEYCIAPVSFATFVEQYWDKEPCVVHRNDPAYFRNLFSLSELDRYVHLIRSDKDPLSIILANVRNPPHADKILGPDGNIESHLVMNAYHQGDTVVFMRMHRFWLPLAKMARTWESLFRHRVTANAYLTPPNSQGLDPHYEKHNVVAIQLHGSKTWEVFPARLPCSIVNSHVPPSEITSPGRKIQLNAGDVLYLPRGVIHRATASQETSLHLCIFVTVYRWLDLLTAAIESAALDEITLRQAIPPGTLLDPQATGHLSAKFDELVRSLPEMLRLRKGIQAAERKFLLEQQPLPDSRIPNLIQLDAIGLNTNVFRYPGTFCSITSDEDAAEITFSGNFLNAPLNTMPALKFIVENKEFCVNQLPGNLRDDAKIVLVRRLVKEGLLGIRS